MGYYYYTLAMHMMMLSTSESVVKGLGYWSVGPKVEKSHPITDKLLMSGR